MLDTSTSEQCKNRKGIFCLRIRNLNNSPAKENHFFILRYRYLSHPRKTLAFSKIPSPAHLHYLCNDKRKSSSSILNPLFTISNFTIEKNHPAVEYQLSTLPSFQFSKQCSQLCTNSEKIPIEFGEQIQYRKLHLDVVCIAVLRRQRRYKEHFLINAELFRCYNYVIVIYLGILYFEKLTTRVVIFTIHSVSTIRDWH